MQSKVILITGASSGIGFETAQLLARQGHRVYAAARSLERMEPLRDHGVEPMAMDLTDDASLQQGVHRVLDAEGRIDVLVNNAGYGYFGAVEHVSMDEARRQLEVNLFGLARLCQLVLPHMRGAGGGRIVNVSSVAGRAVLYFGGWYHVSKFAVEALSDAMRMELQPFGIDVALIEPGGIRTSWGIIAAEHLARSSAGTAYEGPALLEADNLHRAYSSRLLTSPTVVARAIARAVNARRPRTRYRVGFAAGTIVRLHALLPDRWWDALMRLGGRARLDRLLRG